MEVRIICHEVICFLLRVTGAPWLLREVIGKNKITIVNYHKVTAERFEEHIKLFSKLYSFVSIDEVQLALEEKNFKDLPSKPLVVSFDDGHASNAKLFEIIERRGVPVVIYVVAGVVGTNRRLWFDVVPKNDRRKLRLEELSDENRRLILKQHYMHEDDKEYSNSDYLSWSDLNKVLNVGGSIGSHTLTHPILNRCSPEMGNYECEESKILLESKLHINIRHFAYPRGAYDIRCAHWLKAAGYKTARTINPGWVTRSSDPFILPNFGVSDNAGENKAIVQASGLWDIIKNPFVIFRWIFSR